MLIHQRILFYKYYIRCISQITVNLNRSFILIPCPRNACSVFHESILAKLFSSAKFIFSRLYTISLPQGAFEPDSATEVNCVQHLLHKTDCGSITNLCINLTIQTADYCRHTRRVYTQLFGESHCTYVSIMTKPLTKNIKIKTILHCPCFILQQPLMKKANSFPSQHIFPPTPHPFFVLF